MEGTVENMTQMEKLENNIEDIYKCLQNCRDCSNLMLITEHGDFERRCLEKLEPKYEDHDCEKYNWLIKYCPDCD